MAETPQSTGPQTKESEPTTRWWKLPFDTTTNFSLFGFLLGGFRCDSPANRTDMSLEDD